MLLQGALAVWVTAVYAHRTLEMPSEDCSALTDTRSMTAVESVARRLQRRRADQRAPGLAPASGLYKENFF